MASNNKKQPALGRGLSALLANDGTSIGSVSQQYGGTMMIPLDQIEVNPFNPRVDFEPQALQELVSSIQTHGIIQPLTLRKINQSKYQIISGERRFRASQMAGLHEVPAYVRLANDQSMLEMALVENIQRENLNAIEIAVSYQRLIDECELTQAALGERIAKSRSDIANHLRLLKLPDDIQAGLRDGIISMGHARALLSLASEASQLEAYHQILEQHLSVRAVEQMGKKPNGSAKRTPKGKETEIRAIENQILEATGLKSNLSQTAQGKGKITVHFNNWVQLNMLLERLSKK
ncbi:MAG: ParB/RepB/Spo0J family partition protein [Flavobacteriales bacterium]|jgi:ParB family chromosome partitioning protein